MFGKVEEKVSYITPDPVYETVEEVVEKDIYKQETPIMPVKPIGKELVLLDKSGSMEEFITDIYTSNVEFFTQHDIWAFDTDVYQDVSINDITFGGDTDIFKAINMAAEQGYNTIWLCSDLENTTGEMTLLETAKEMTIIVYSPKTLNKEKSMQTLEALKECKTRVITIS